MSDVAAPTVFGTSSDVPLPREPELKLKSEDDDDDNDTQRVVIGRDILIVDDNDTNLIAIEAALAQLGRNLVLARSGVEALGRLLEQDFALIILDVAMPGMDGFETARLVRSRSRSRTTPIIFITGMSWQDEDILRGYQLGAFDFMLKPIRPEVLRAKATVFIDLQERTRELHEKGLELRAAQERAHSRDLEMQRKRFETEVLAQQMKQMAEADRKKDEFLAILAHELRNPLQPLQTAIEIMAHEHQKPVPERVRNIIKRQVHHIGRLVDDLLDVARFQTGKLQLRREPIALEGVVDEAATNAKAAIESRKHSLEIVGDGSSPTVFGDSTRLTQILSNLLSNAIKYTESGGKITVSWGTDGDSAFVRVSDSGRGIEQALLPRVFDMFVQERVTGDGSGGLGLGLGLVKRLVELHQGTVHALSDGLGKGATFEVKLPLADAENLDKWRPKGSDAIDDQPLKAVVVDDAPDLRELVADLLRMKGHEVTTVEDGPSALRAIKELRPDVALIDIGLPDMDGYEVARTLCRDLGVQRPRLIAMTGYGQAADRASAFQAGFDAHIVKPASAEKIMRAIYGKSEDS
jgi:signal transduction histidine kinase